MRRSALTLGLPEIPGDVPLSLPGGNRVLKLILERAGLRCEARPLPLDLDRERRLGISLATTRESWLEPQHKRVDRSIQRRLETEKGGETARLDRQGRLWESTRSNLFAVRAGALETADPPLVLPGIARAVVLEEAHRLGIRVIHRPPRLERVGEELEIFATNAIRGVRPVRSLDRRPLAPPGALARELQRALDARMGLPPAQGCPKGLR